MSMVFWIISLDMGFARLLPYIRTTQTSHEQLQQEAAEERLQTSIHALVSQCDALMLKLVSSLKKRARQSSQ